ncbi:conserved Plasmodium protein, unknown function [Plasmodium malariae]|uniref:GPI transamidase component GPI16 n=1 Tax=Plasmodium malariae TaxID=5858 RepID=A0A1D3RJA1_PLAMA|nr:conserved Plasmodium protein, unknown function [Plasmodium malariae]SCN45158.1 conserved Plasmodium protein, unknown function [Plasmodium malariae]
MKNYHLVFVVVFLCVFLFNRINNGELLSMDTINNLMKKGHVIEDNKNFTNFSFFYLYNALRCTLTQQVFESYEDEKYEREIFIIKNNLLRLKEQKDNRNLWIFFEFHLFDSLISSIEEIETHMRNYSIGLMEMFNELKLADPRFSNMVDLTLNICDDPIFAVEEVSMYLVIVPFLLEKLEISAKTYTDEMKHLLRKTLNCLHIFISLICEHNINITDIYKKEVRMFLKVKESFDFVSLNEDNILSLHDEIYLKNKYGNMLIKDLFLLFKKIFFYEMDEERLYYYNYIQVVPIYVKTEKGIYKSKSYNREKSFYSLIESVYKKELQVNEGIIMITVFKQYNIKNDAKNNTKTPYYFDADIIYKIIMHQVYKPISPTASDINFNFLYSTNIDSSLYKTTEEDITLSLILLIDTTLNIEDLLEKMYNSIFSNDIFLTNKELNKQRIKVIGSCIYNQKSQAPIFQGFFSRGLSSYILFKIREWLKPNQKLIYLSIEKAEDHNHIRSGVIAERILNNPQQLYQVVLLFERNAIIKFDKFEQSDECDMCLVGYKGLYTLYLCIFIPTTVSLIICYFLYKKKKNTKKNMVDVKADELTNKRISIEPSIAPLKI